MNDVIERFFKADQNRMTAFSSANSDGAKTLIELYLSLHRETQQEKHHIIDIWNLQSNSSHNYDTLKQNVKHQEETLP